MQTCLHLMHKTIDNLLTLIKLTWSFLVRDSDLVRSLFGPPGCLSRERCFTGRFPLALESACSTTGSSEVSAVLSASGGSRNNQDNESKIYNIYNAL